MNKHTKIIIFIDNIRSVDLETVQFFAPDVAINLTDLQQFLNEREDNRIDRIYNGDRSIFNFDTINDDITIQQTKYTVLLQNLILLCNEIDSYVLVNMLLRIKNWCIHCQINPIQFKFHIWIMELILKCC